MEFDPFLLPLNSQPIRLTNNAEVVINFCRTKP